MNKLVVATLVTLAAAAGTLAGAERPRGSVAARPSAGDATLEAKSHGATRRLGPSSFCAKPNGEPVALACGTEARAPRSRGLVVHPRGRVELQFRAPVARLFASFKLGAGGQRLVELTQPVPVAPSTDPTRWTVHLPPGGAEPIRRGTVLGLLAIYRDPVRLDLGNRLSAPFEEAIATFELPLRRHRHRR